MGRGGLSRFLSSPLILLCCVGSYVYSLYISDKSPWRKKNQTWFFPSHLQWQRQFIWITNSKVSKLSPWKLVQPSLYVWSVIPTFYMQQHKCADSLVCQQCIWVLLNWGSPFKRSSKSRYCLVNVIIMWKMMYRAPLPLSTSSALQPTQMPPSISLHCWQAKATLPLLISLRGPLCVFACVCVYPSVFGHPSVGYHTSLPLLPLRLQDQQPLRTFSTPILSLKLWEVGFVHKD